MAPSVACRKWFGRSRRGTTPAGRVDLAPNRSGARVSAQAQSRSQHYTRPRARGIANEGAPNRRRVAGWCRADGSAQGPAVARAAGEPTITSLSASTLPRSGRLLINGSGFGVSQGSSVLSIGGLTALVTRWSDTLVFGYVPEAAPIGIDDVQVTPGGATSNAVPLSVMTRQVDGRVKWRFQVDAQYGYLLQRPAVGPDGTVVAHDPAGNIYALTPDGGLKWIFKTPSSAAGPPSIGADGTVYVASIATIYALAADGTLKWTFTEPAGGQGVIIGPTVGPDGNIYAVTDLGGIGALALSPAGGSFSGLMIELARARSRGSVGSSSARICRTRNRRPRAVATTARAPRLRPRVLAPLASHARPSPLQAGLRGGSGTREGVGLLHLWTRLPRSLRWLVRR